MDTSVQQIGLFPRGQKHSMQKQAVRNAIYQAFCEKPYDNNVLLSNKWAGRTVQLYDSHMTATLRYQKSKRLELIRLNLKIFA